jgi:hypothetical protein
VRRWIPAILAGGLAAAWPRPAAANGRFPQSNQIVFSPIDKNLIVLRTTYGILPSHDNGATWSFVCEDALGINTMTSLLDPPLGLTENNALNVGTPTGMNVSNDVGCNWNCIGGAMANQSIVDLAVRPDAPSRLVAMTGTYQATDSAQDTIYGQAFESTDNGVTWAPVGPALDPTVLPSTIEVSRSNPDLLYVSGTRGVGVFTRASLFVYDKSRSGQGWTEWPLPTAQFDSTQEDSIYVSGVDPTNANRIYIRSRSQVTGGLSRLTVATLGPDGGPPTFQSAYSFTVPTTSNIMRYVGEMQGFALSEDGTKVYIGSVEQGLWAAQTSDLKFQKTSTIEVQCLATRGSELWACSAAKDGFIAGVSTDDGRTFTPKLRLIGDLTGPIACAPNEHGLACDEDANSSQCSVEYQTFCSSNPCGADAGVATGGSSSSCACEIGPAAGEGAAALASGFVLAGFAMRRRGSVRRGMRRRPRTRQP